MCWLIDTSKIALLAFKNEVPLVAQDEDHLYNGGGDHLDFGTIGL